jgi:uncharacterized coiled-coil DUF342 family protein
MRRIFSATGSFRNFPASTKILKKNERYGMKNGDETDHFQVLETRVESLIRFATSLRDEKETLAEKIRSQEEKIAELNRELEQLRETRDMAKTRILSLLEKIQHLDI